MLLPMTPLIVFSSGHVPPVGSVSALQGSPPTLAPGPGPSSPLPPPPTACNDLSNTYVLFEGQDMDNKYLLNDNDTFVDNVTSKECEDYCNARCDCFGYTYYYTIWNFWRCGPRNPLRGDGRGVMEPGSYSKYYARLVAGGTGCSNLSATAGGTTDFLHASSYGLSGGSYMTLLTDNPGCQSACEADCRCSAFSYNWNGTAYECLLFSLAESSQVQDGGNLYLRLPNRSAALQGSPSFSPPPPSAPGPGPSPPPSGPGPSPPLSPPPTAKEKSFPWPAVGSTGALAVLLALALSCWLLYRRRRKYSRQPFGAPGEPEEFDGLKVYSYSKLENATSQFADKLGGGGSAQVFRGVLDGKVVAVKRLKELEERKSSESEFRSEAKGLGLLQHVNLVRLLGYSAEHGRPKMLVYEFVPGGSLDSLLYGAQCANFSLQRRMEIARGIARGIEYCHHSIEAPLIHRDLKPANILMTSADVNGVPKIADFGLAKIAPQLDSEQPGGRTIVDMIKLESSSSYSSGATSFATSGATSGAQPSGGPLPLRPAGNTHTTYVAGTHGYIDPEYLYTGVATLKSDVYSFGMVVLELLLGRSPMYIFAELSAGAPPCVWLAELISKGEWEAAELVGATLGQKIVDTQGCFQLLNIVLECLQEKGQDRPTMRNVATRLDSDHAA